MPMEAFFLPAASGQRFCLYHRPEEPAAGQGALVFVHPFAEEMNKSRRMAAVQARALAAAGYGVLQIDLHGCGDSSGAFGDAAWNAWVEDVRLACAWVRERTDLPLWLWGMRAGCLVAAAAARGLEQPANFLFWQPTPSGRLFLQQFFRLKVAGALQDGDGKELVQELRRQLAAGERVDVAGYLLSPTLAEGLEQADLAPPAGPGRLEWLEITSQPEATLSPASQRCLEAWRAAGHRVRGRVVSGQRFWQTVDATECPSLIQATIETLQEETCP